MCTAVGGSCTNGGSACAVGAPERWLCATDLRAWIALGLRAGYARNLRHLSSPASDLLAPADGPHRPAPSSPRISCACGACGRLHPAGGRRACPRPAHHAEGPASAVPARPPARCQCRMATRPPRPRRPARQRPARPGRHADLRAGRRRRTGTAARAASPGPPAGPPCWYSGPPSRSQPSAISPALNSASSGSGRVQCLHRGGIALPDGKAEHLLAQASALVRAHFAQPVLPPGRRQQLSHRLRPGRDWYSSEQLKERRDVRCGCRIIDEIAPGVRVRPVPMQGLHEGGNCATATVFLIAGATRHSQPGCGNLGILRFLKARSRLHECPFNARPVAGRPVVVSLRLGPSGLRFAERYAGLPIKAGQWGCWFVETGEKTPDRGSQPGDDLVFTWDHGRGRRIEVEDDLRGDFPRINLRPAGESPAGIEFQEGLLYGRCDDFQQVIALLAVDVEGDFRQVPDVLAVDVDGYRMRVGCVVRFWDKHRVQQAVRQRP